jgi:hypothetical protein
MGVKIGGDSQQFSDYLGGTPAGEQPLGEVPAQVEREDAAQATNAQRLSANADPRFRVPTNVSVQARAGEDPKELLRRILRQAASEAGLDGTAEQEEFVRMFENSGIKFKTAADDPSPGNGLDIRRGDLTGQTLTYELTGEREVLQRLQRRFESNGGRLRRGRDYTAAGGGGNVARRQVVDNAAYERRRMEELLRNAQILPSSFGTPSKLRDLRHVSVNLLNTDDYGGEDLALLSYIQKTYGYEQTGLYGDKVREILSLAKERGVRVENLSVEGGRAEFDLSVENLLKLHHVFIGVREKFNADMEVVNSTVENLAHNRFAKGVFEGAWDTLKANWQMISDPVGTLKGIKEAVQVLANLSREDLLKIYENLKQAGYDLVFTDDVSDVAEKAGRVVGAALVELALGKGTGLLLRALKGTRYAAALVEKGKEVAAGIKNTVGRVPIVPPGFKVAVTTDGTPILMKTSEWKRLDDLIKPLQTSARQVFSSGGGVIDAQIVREAKETVAKLAREGKAEELKNFLAQMHQRYGNDMVAELGDTVTETVERLNGARRDIDAYELLGGHTVEKHVGKTERWLRDRLINDPELRGEKFASSFYDKAVANRAQMQAVKTYRSRIDDWLRGESGRPLKLDVDVGEPAGIVVTRGRSGSTVSSKVRVVIVRDNTAQGWHVLTSFPVAR